MYYKTTVYAGKTLEVYRGYSPDLCHGSRSSKVKATPEEIEKVNRKNAEATLRRLINHNFHEGDFHMVLTYKKEERPDEKHAKEELDKFIRQMKRAYKKNGYAFKYIHVTEFENKSIHHHMIFNNIPGEDVTDLVSRLWPHGYPKFSRLDDSGQYKELAAYLIKETDKTFRKSQIRKQRYSRSRNLELPIVKKEVIKRSDAWHKDPKIPPGYYLDKSSLINGVNPFTNTMYQSYTLILVSDMSQCSKTLRKMVGK